MDFHSPEQLLLPWSSMAVFFAAGVDVYLVSDTAMKGGGWFKDADF